MGGGRDWGGREGGMGWGGGGGGGGRKERGEGMEIEEGRED